MSTQKSIEDLILERVQDHPGDLVAVVAKAAGVSRQTVHRHLRRLLDSGKIVKVGERKGTCYSLAGAQNVDVRLKVSSNLEEHVVYARHVEPSLRRLPENVRDICHYGFTEILNNVIDHAQARSVRINLSWESVGVTLGVSDDGVGIFEKIANAFGLSDRREAILHLSKGKVTTDPDHHTGEGIFFTSRAFDSFTILSGGLAFLRFHDEDWLLERRETKEGTSVQMAIAPTAERRLKDVFGKYTDPATLQFDATHVVVGLSRLEGERFISRSQAKRVLLGLEQFRSVVLDFKGVTSVGQGFVDEVFRVYRSQHPEVQITYANANDDVEFMIRRSLALMEPPSP